MDGRTTYSKIKDIFEDREGVITIHEIRKLLIMNVGSDERTITSCLRIMAEVGMIKDLGEFKFEIIK